MAVLLWLIFLFLFLPWVEFVILLKLARVTDIPTTLAIIILTGIVGASLARWQGFRTITRIRSQLNKGALPADAMLDGLFILCAGLLLITPGLITDGVGFTLLMPPARALIKKAAAKYIRAHFHVSQFQQFTGRPDAHKTRNTDPNVIDVDATEIDENDD